MAIHMDIYTDSGLYTRNIHGVVTFQALVKHLLLLEGVVLGGAAVFPEPCESRR